MEKNLHITICDICNRWAYYKYDDLRNYGWTKYKYKKEWREGIHRGEYDLEFTVCDKCDKGKGIRFLFYKIKYLLFIR